MTSPFTIQVLFGALFGLLLIRLAVMGYRGSIPRLRAVFWGLLWGVGLLFVLSPSLSFRLAAFLGVTRGTDAVTYVAIAALSVLVFRAFQLLDAQDREISRLTTQLALYEWEKDRKL